MGRSVKLTGGQIRGVSRMYLNGRSYQAIADKYGVSVRTIMRIVKENQFDLARKELMGKNKDIMVDEFSKTFKEQMKHDVRELAPTVNKFIKMLGKSIDSIVEQFEEDPEKAEKRFRALGGVKALDAIVSLIGKTENNFEQKVVHKLDVPDNYEELGADQLERILNGEEVSGEYELIDEED